MEKIKQNLDKIIKVLSIVAMALFIPSIFGYLDDDISTTNVGPIIYMTRLVLLVGAAGILLLIECKKCDKYSLLPIILLSSANLLSYGYSLISSSNIDFALLPTVALYVAIIVLALLKARGGNILNAYLILLLIAVAFAFSSAIGGGSTSLGLFIILTLILLKEYFKERE